MAKSQRPTKATPFGVLKPDPAARIAETNAPVQTPDEAPEHDWVIEPGTGMAYIRGSQPGEQADIRDAKWRPGDEAKPVPLPYNPKDEEPRWVYDPITGNSRWVEPKKIQLLSSNESPDQAQAEETGRDADEVNHGLLAPYLDRRAPQVGPGFEVAQNSGTMSDADPAQIAQAPAPEAPKPPAMASNLERLKNEAAPGQKWFGESKECVALVKHATGLDATSTWREGEKITPDNVGTLKPSTAIATFEKDPKSNGELRYPSRPSGNHAGIFIGAGERNGQPGIWVFDQYRGQIDREGKQSGDARIRFYPNERPPGQPGYRAGNFSVIQGR